MSVTQEKKGCSARPSRGKAPDVPVGGKRADLQDGRPREIGGRDGPDPVRYGDWEKDGRCIDF